MHYRRLLAVALVAGTALIGTIPAATAEEVVVKLWARADRSGPLRAGNIVAETRHLDG